MSKTSSHRKAVSLLVALSFLLSLTPPAYSLRQPSTSKDGGIRAGLQKDLGIVPSTQWAADGGAKQIDLAAIEKMRAEVREQLATELPYDPNVLGLEREGRVAIVTINDTRLTSDITKALYQTMEALDKDDTVDVIILTGKGENYMVGGDLPKMLEAAQAKRAMEVSLAAQIAFGRVEQMKKPIIAAVNGPAVGGGTSLVMTADHIIAVETAQFGLSQITLQFNPGDAATQRLSRRIGPRWTAILGISGSRINANQAKSIGLIDEIVPKEQLLSRAAIVASTLKAKRLLPPGQMETRRLEAQTLMSDAAILELLKKNEEAGRGEVALKIVDLIVQGAESDWSELGESYEADAFAETIQSEGAITVMQGVLEKKFPAALPIPTEAFAVKDGGLRAITAQIVSPTGGILAADESVGTAGKRLASVARENTAENRQVMRRILLTTPNLKSEGIDAVILDRDTLTNTTPDGQMTLVDYLKAQGIIPGLKTDEGLDDDPAYPAKTGVKLPKDSQLTKLPALLEQATSLGLGFTKYRTTVRVNDPPEDNMRTNAKVQARQARLAQAANLVPVVEPEVIFDGSDGSPATHDLAASAVTTIRMLEMTFEELSLADVALDGMILKTSMILAGKNAPQQTDPETVGFETLKGLLQSVPPQVPTIVFLSGGQGDDQATANLDAVARAGQSRFTEARDAAVVALRERGLTDRADTVAALTAVPWQLSYSFGRGLQARALKAWGGNDEQFDQAQVAMLATAREVKAARQGRLQDARDGGSRNIVELRTRIGQEIGVYPISFRIRPDAVKNFLSGRIPENSEELFELKNILPLLATQSIATDALRGGWIGKAAQEGVTAKEIKDKEKQLTAEKTKGEEADKVLVEQLEVKIREMKKDRKNYKDLGDLRAQDLLDQIARFIGLRLVNDAFEHKGEVKGAHDAGSSTADLAGVETHSNSDVWELTDNVVDGLPGSSSLQIVGPGAGYFGSFPDEARALMVSTHINPELEDLVLIGAGHNRGDLEEYLDPLHQPVDRLVERVAKLNGVTPNEVDVTILTGDESDIQSLQRLQSTYSGLRVDRVSGGTVQPAFAGFLGVKDKRVRVFVRRSGMAEAILKTVFTAPFTADGAITLFKVVSPEIKRGNNQWNNWPADVVKKVQALRKDWSEIADGTKTFSSRDIRGDVIGAYTFLTDGRTDKGLPFDAPGVQEENGAFKVQSLVVASNPKEPGKGYLVPVEGFYATTEGMAQILNKEIPEFSMPLTQAEVDSKEKATIVVYEDSLNNLSIARMIDLKADQLRNAGSKIGFSLIATSGKSELEVAQKILKDSGGVIDLRGAFQQTLTQGEVDVNNPEAVVEALGLRGLPVRELIAPEEVVEKYKGAAIKLYAYLVSGNPKEEEGGIANGAPALQEMLALFGLSQGEKEALLRNGGKAFTVVIQHVGQEVEDLDRFYRENRGV